MGVPLNSFDSGSGMGSAGAGQSRSDPGTGKNGVMTVTEDGGDNSVQCLEDAQVPPFFAKFGPFIIPLFFVLVGVALIITRIFFVKIWALGFLGISFVLIGSFVTFMFAKFGGSASYTTRKGRGSVSFGSSVEIDLKDILKHVKL